MEVMNAVGWIGIMFLVGALIRAKIKPIGNMMVPSCLIGGVVGCVLMNTCGVGFGVTMNEFSTISGQMYNFLFINMGVTVAAAGAQAAEKKEKVRSIKDIRRRMGEGPLSGILGMGSYWMVGYCLQGIVGFVILYFIGGFWDMDPVYGLMLPFAYAQGPGQSIAFGTPIEAAGWAGAIQVGIMFSAVGFLIAFLLGVPFAKKGIKNGLPCSKAELSDELKVGFFPPEKQESYGKITVFGGNLDTMTFHLAVTGAAWILGKVFCIFLDMIPMGSIQLGTTIFFFWGMLALRAWHYDENHYSGAIWLLYVMILVWGADSGAYMFGKLFGKHKLAPKVSPGKTWQGFIGGLATAAVISWGYGMWANLDVAPVTLLICSIVAALASVLGDLTESMFKREAGIKDSGHLIPGHGGILDRIDSLTAAVPVFACLLLLVFRTL